MASTHLEKRGSFASIRKPPTWRRKPSHPSGLFMLSGPVRRWWRNMTTFSNRLTQKATRSRLLTELCFVSNTSASIPVSLFASGRVSGCSRAVKLRMPAKSSRELRPSYEGPILTDRHSVVFAALIAATSVSTIAPQILAFTNAAVSLS